MKERRLNQVLTLNFILAAVFPFLVFGLLAQFWLQSSLRQKTHEANLQTTRTLAAEIEALLEAGAGDLQQVGDRLEEPGLSEDGIPAYLESVIRYGRAFETIMILDDTGSIRHIAPAQPGSLGADRSFQEHYPEADPAGTSQWSGSFVSHRTGRPAVTASIRRGPWTVVGFLDLSRLNDLLARHIEGRSAHAALADRQGTPIVHPDPGMVDGRFDAWARPEARRALEGREGTFRYRFAGERRIASLTRLPTTGWTVAVIQPERAAYALVRHTLAVLGTGILITVAAAGTASAMRRRITTPIHRLVGMARRVSGGDYQPETQSTRYREVAELEEAFQAMSGAIRSREASLRAGEEQYRELVQEANSIIFRWDRQGTLTFANDYGLRFFGFERPEEVLGRPLVGTLVPPEESSGRDLKRMVDDLLEHPERYLSNVNENMRRDGQRVWVQWSNKPIYDPHGRLAEILSIGNDITERRRLEERLQQAQKLEAVGRLAGGIAHDFNNLITAINGYGELILDRLGPEDPIRQDVQEIIRAGRRAAALTEQLLAFSRKQMLQPRVVDLNHRVRGMTGLLRRLIGEDVELEVRLHARPCVIRADPHRIEQVVMNLAVNARDAMPTGGRLTLSTRHLDLEEAEAGRRKLTLPPGPYVLLSCRDTGTGMSAETLANLFEPFFTTKEVGRGTGLGLSMVYGIVRQSGGEITVHSEPGAGSTFTVYLPRVHPPSPEEPTASRGLEKLHGGETILLVEDDPSVRRFTATLLERFGYRVLEASSSAEALRLFEENGASGGAPDGVDLVLTDVIMPGGSGRELADRLVARRPGLRVLFASGYTGETIARHGLSGDGAAFIQKPYSVEDLLHKVREVLGREAP